MIFLNSLQSELLKTRRSAASWLCLSGGLFLPVLFLVAFFIKRTHLNKAGHKGNAWIELAGSLWHFMGILLLPLGIVLAASLLLQLEYRNNCWKQLHITPQSYTSIFGAKLLTLVLMLLKWFLFFNIGMIVAGILPTLLLSGRMPDDAFPFGDLLVLNAQYLLAALPVVVLQFSLSILFRNFMVSIGIGLLMIVAALILIETWKYAWLDPYCYSPMMVTFRDKMPERVNIYWIEAGYSLIFTAIAYMLYRFRSIKS